MVIHRIAYQLKIIEENGETIYKRLRRRRKDTNPLVSVVLSNWTFGLNYRRFLKVFLLSENEPEPREQNVAPGLDEIILKFACL